MTNKITLLTLCSLLFSSGAAGRERSPDRFPGCKHGFPGIAVLLEAFWQELRKRGWIEGKNIAIEYRFAEGKTKRLPELAAELVYLKVDLIVVAGTGPALAAKNATNSIPIVMGAPAIP